MDMPSLINPAIALGYPIIFDQTFLDEIIPICSRNRSINGSVL